MKKPLHKIAASLLFSLLLPACAVPLTPTSRPSDGVSSPPVRQLPPARVISLGESTYSEDTLGRFVTWGCREWPYVSGRPIVVEVGRFENELLSGEGFALYDGSSSGESTSYQRKGVNQRWDWGPNGSNFAFILEPDGTGLFYDFSNVPKGETRKPNSLYRCSRR